MSAVNNVAPVWGMAALERTVKPSENPNQGLVEKPAQPAPDGDTYTPGQQQVSGSDSGPSGTAAAQEYQNLGRLGAAARPAEAGEQPQTVEQTGGADSLAAQNEAAQATLKVTNPYQVQQATNNLAAKPDAAIMSAISLYA